MKRIILILGVLIGNNTWAQPSDSLTAQMENRLMANDFGAGIKLSMGSQLPDVFLKTIKMKTPAVNLSAYRGKLLILDFWTQWCASCLELMPHLADLQKLYGDKIVILPITYQSAGSAKKTLDAHSIPFPSIVEDTLLHAFFPHRGEPFDVWIDANGKVLAMTAGNYVKKENIDAVLAGKSISFADFSAKPAFSIDKPLFTTNNDGRDSDFIYRSVIGGQEFSNGCHLEEFSKSDSSSTNISVVNAEMTYLYKYAYAFIYPEKVGKPGAFLTKRILFDERIFRDIHKFYWKGSYAGVPNPVNSVDNLYSYSLNLPAGYSLQDAARWMITDLDRFFHVQSAFHRQKVQCLALRVPAGYKAKISRDMQSASYNSNSGIDSVNFDKPEYYINLINNHFNTRNIPLLIDETGLKNKMIYAPLGLKPGITAIDIQQELQKYGVSLVPVEKEMDVLVLKK